MPSPVGIHHAARDGEEMASRSNGQDWTVSWHPPAIPPDGKPHGAAGICVTGDGEIILISTDRQKWDLPAGRPEGDETWEETLRREMREEACAHVVQAHLLGFGRSTCMNGHEAGLVIVRSLWRAEVELAPWDPQFEIAYRCVVPAPEVWNLLALSPENGLDRLLIRALHEAGITMQNRSPLA